MTPNATPCFPYQCGAAVCKNACTTDLDCAPPAVCSSSGSCGLKGNGQSCAGAAECLSGFCAQGVCCGSACQGACQSCALANFVGDLLERAVRRHRSAGDLPRHGQRQLRDGRVLQRQWRVPPLRRRHVVRALFLPGGQRDSHLRTHLRRQGHLPGGDDHPVRALRLQRHDQLQGGLHRRRRLSVTRDLRSEGQPVRQQEAPRSGLRVDGRLPDRQHLRRRRLLQHQRLPDLPGLQRDRQRRQLRQRAGHQARAARPVRRRIRPAARRARATAPASASWAARPSRAAPPPASGATFTPVSHCNGRGACAAPTSSACAGNFECGSTTPASRPARRDAECVAPFTCQGSGPTKSCALQAQRTGLQRGESVHQRLLHRRRLLRHRHLRHLPGLQPERRGELRGHRAGHDGALRPVRR